MSHLRRLAVFALLVAMCTLNARAEDNRSEIKTVFVIAMENHNWTQPANQFTGGIQQIFQNPNAPYINSLVNGTATAIINGRQVNISEQVAFANNYRNVLATAGSNPHIHPSEPNYIWAEAGTNFGVFNDSDPFSPLSGTLTIQNQDNQLHLTRLLDQCGVSWKSYQEDIDLVPDGTSFDNIVLPQNQWTSPVKSFSGIFVAGTNQFNGSKQFNYAVKHNPMAFFTDSNGGNDLTTTNPERLQYAPLQQLFTDLANNTVARYNWITPNQFNDQHTALTGGFKGVTGDAANLLQGDNFLQIVIPEIMASKAYKDHGAIILWWDEAEGDGVSGDNPDDLTHTIPEIVISTLAHPNEGGIPFASDAFLTHSSDLRTMQEIFHVTKPFFLGDAIHANDLSSLFADGAIRSDRDGDGDNEGCRGDQDGH
ncbi:MAG TPA: alkaline phosphatase family protein [Candidatus Angelobacter sp.]|nr:alkaline phosphatase family protein [Candidatus Angelobacter sp.]